MQKIFIATIAIGSGSEPHTILQFQNKGVVDYLLVTAKNLFRNSNEKAESKAKSMTDFL